MKTLQESLLDDEDMLIDDESAIEDMLKNIKTKKIGNYHCYYIAIPDEKRESANFKGYWTGMGFSINLKKHYVGYKDDPDGKKFLIEFFLCNDLFLQKPTLSTFSNRYICSRFLFTPIINKFSTLEIPDSIIKLTEKYNDLLNMSKEKLGKYLINKLIEILDNKFELVIEFDKLIYRNGLIDDPIYDPIIDNIAEKILR